MERDDWIKGRTEGDKTYYKMTKLGGNQLKEFVMSEMDFMIRIHQSISIASEIFEDPGPLAIMAHNEIMQALEPLFVELGILLQKGTESQKIHKVIRKTVMDLKKLEVDK